MHLTAQEELSSTESWWLYKQAGLSLDISTRKELYHHHSSTASSTRPQPLTKTTHLNRTNMDPRESLSADEQPGPGVQLVEESPEPHLNIERDEEPAALATPQPPHAEHAEDANRNQLPEASSADINEEGVAQLRGIEADPAVADVAPEHVRHLRAVPEGEARPLRVPAAPALPQAWPSMHTLTPEQRTIILNFIAATQALWPEIIINPARVIPNRNTLIPAFTDSADALHSIMSTLPQDIHDMIHEVSSEAIQHIGSLIQLLNQIPNAGDRAASRQNVVPLLDSLLNTNLQSLGSDVPQHDSTRCTVCFEDYEESDGIVVLPCHPTHHFHRTCIHFGSRTSHLPQLQSPDSLPEPTQPSPSVSPLVAWPHP
ncbi:hypothetical protein PGTUg99_008683 [Puccinia graminis f. sp. tritici]|uniref:RING-type domain-containing protein n=1 Tax=Puccinia graminis f. sp. tritici TaxID=56615 RepID=A0A5B0RU86_PUCGR|nr:hypothetical protein PGTUg99_008683 [Puccinia graminis f. sp. tritici]